jgi:hypothetical protein
MRGSLIVLAVGLVGFLPAIAQESPDRTASLAASSAFLPMIGQTAQYEYSDALMAQKKTRRFAATLTLTSFTAKEIRASIAIKGQESRSLDFYVDDTGALLPVSLLEADSKSTNKRRNSRQRGQADSLQAFISRVALASRIGMQPAQETSFLVKITVPGASCPLNPTLVLKATQPEELVADASDTTSVSSTKANRHLFMPLGLGIGAGFIGGAIGGTPGRIVGISISATSLVITLLRSHRSDSLPADVDLHIDGKLADSRLQTLSGDQEVIVHGKRPRTISDKWRLVAGSAVSAGL